MHAIKYLDISCRNSEKAIVKYCSQIANTYGDYEDQITDIRFRDKVVKNRAEAEEWIKSNDTGWYDNLAIKYKDGRKTMWLVKIEYHC